MHELGHSFVANDRGYKLNKITLMPFGAVVSGDLDNLKAKDEIKIALAGPFLNLFVGVFFVALWWIFPETYAYTDIVAEANFSMAIVNFIPAYPLDGGRVLCAIISLYKDRKTALKICRIIGGVMAGVLIALFIYSCFTSVNLSILLFALFILSGLFVKNTGYIRAIEFPSALSLKRGVPYKKQALDKSATVKRLYDILDPEAVNEIVIFDNDIPIATLSQQTINSIIATKDFYTPIINHIAKTEKIL